MNRLARIWWTAKGVGWDNLPRRILQAWRCRTGWLGRQLDPKRFSRQTFQRFLRPDLDQRQRSLWYQRQRRFLPVPSKEFLQEVCEDGVFGQAVTNICQKAMTGEYPFFSRWSGQLGWPPNFNLDPVHNIPWPVGPHWTTSAKSGPPRDDIKLVWEPSRFSLAYLLGRAYTRTGDSRWAEAFWTMLDAWVRQNPSQLTVAWGCGQETAFRLMAMLFGAMTTLDSPAATNDRLTALTCLTWQFGRRIHANINYARSQKNNHGISEAVGLWTVGTLFGELSEADTWRKEGAAILAAEVRRQVYPDGSFVQHSMNYHRVMMDDLLWAAAISRRANLAIPPIVLDGLARATSWIEQMLDPHTGRVPNYGPNDGALVLPLDCCDYLDYRPTVQAARVLLDGKRCLPPGPWDEKALWLTGTEFLRSSPNPSPRPATIRFDAGGYYILRGKRSWAMTRCHTYRDRPAQADMLHLDLWRDGVNVLRDGGSYSYNCPEPWKRYFIGTAAHNTLQVDNQDQLVKGPRFLWFAWTRSKLLALREGSDGLTHRLVAEHYGYRRLAGSPVHRRTIERAGDTWTVTDELLGEGEHDVTLRWRLCPADWQLADERWQATIAGTTLAIAVQAPWPGQLVQGLDEGPEGWESLYYGQKTPAPTLLCRGRARLPIRLVTQIGPTKPPPIPGGPIGTSE